VVGRLADLKKATDNFTRNLDALTPEQVTDMPNVSREFVVFLPNLFDVFHPKHFSELRRAIAYLNYMHIAQAEAWAKIARAWQDDADLLKTITETADPEERRRLTIMYCDEHSAQK
jgi:hypothetical protein